MAAWFSGLLRGRNLRRVLLKSLARAITLKLNSPIVND